jgi:hypothetical protein
VTSTLQKESNNERQLVETITEKQPQQQQQQREILFLSETRNIKRNCRKKSKIGFSLLL